MQFVILAVALAHIVNAQISTAGCTNLRAVFTAFGFTTAPTTAVNTAFTSCGCSFTVTVPAGSTAAAACQLTSDVWSINSVSISRPPNTLSAFPPVLVAPSNSAGFEWCQSL
ncbi:hypothetical protein BDR26DRAFT_850908 [Obelidium mucronatum]|nr:hypothetical protein BDR26DRAFT_850908 [Obelidium mucronatum]